VVALVLARLALSARERAELRAAFALHPRELSFVRCLVRDHPRFHAFRTHQRSACGDFVLVDMSSHEVDRRRVFAVELKAGGALSESPSVQLARLDHAMHELWSEGVIGRGAVPRILRGGAAQVRREILGWEG